VAWENDEGSEPVSVGKVVCVGATPRALKVRKGSGMEARTTWIPRSVVHEDSEVQEQGDEGDLFVAEWYALKEGL
jgi:hypothetical protein